ncbi:MAG: N-glycosylase/DNA lyase [Bacteroidota bacterium]|nr:N-glycosylase/DNA lyase [Bacteroidota bacterium]
MKKLYDTYNIIKSDIIERIADFKLVWRTGDENRIFQELTFCLLTPQSKAENAWKTILILTENQKLYKGNSAEIAEDLNLVRFRNNKARYIVKAREMYFNNHNVVKKILTAETSAFEKRIWLSKNILGYGLKESSHFLRNIGFVEDITILDRHILKNLKKYSVINEIPKSISEKKYYEIEDKMKEFSEQKNIPLEYLDLIFWYNEAKTIFK